MVIRYADALVALCHSQRQAQDVKARVAEWLAPRGLTFNEEKTKIVSIDDDGYDFLGFSIRRYHGKLLIKPSQAAIQRFRERLRTEFRALRGANAAAVIAKINPITRGWSAYYRGVVSSRIFASLDSHLWVLCHKMGDLQTRQQAEEMDRGPLLRQVQQVQERSLGVRRRNQRRLPGETCLDRHRPAHHGQRHGIPR
jgi:RNA-directed DNA polymerase